MGQPFLASPQNEAFYPFRVLSLITNFAQYEQAFVLFHTAIAILGMSVLVYDWSRNFPSAVLAGLAAGFHGFFLARVTDHSDFASMAWVPLAFFCLSRRSTAALALTLCLQWMAGFPPFSILTIVGLGVLAASFSEPKTYFWCLAKGAVLGGALSAVQGLPFLEMLRESQRALLLDPGAALAYSMDPWSLLRAWLLPGAVVARLPFVVPDTDPAVTGFYLGPFILALSAWGFWKGGRRERVLAAGAAGACILSLGSYTGFYGHIPFITVFRFPAHWLLLSSALIIPVAAHGAARLADRRAAWVFIALVAVDFLGYAWPVHASWGDLDFVAYTRVRVAGLDNIPAGTRIFHTDIIMRRIHLWKITEKEDWLVFKGLFTPSYGAAFGIRDVAGFFQLESRRNIAYRARLNAAPLGSPLFDNAGISRIVTLTREGALKPMPGWKDCGVFENSHPKPHAFSPEGRPVVIEEDRPGRCRCRVQGPATVVYSESYYPGWMALIDGKKSPAEIFDDKFVSARVGAGEHLIEWYYFPRSVALGAGISLMALLFWGGLLWFELRALQAGKLEGHQEHA